MLNICCQNKQLAMGQANRSNSESLSWRDFSIKLGKQVLEQGDRQIRCGGNWTSRTKGAAPELRLRTEERGTVQPRAGLPAEAGNFPLAPPFSGSCCNCHEARRRRALMDTTGSRCKAASRAAEVYGTPRWAGHRAFHKLHEFFLSRVL